VFTPEDYELIDFGDGRRLERFQGVIVDRPCPAADGLLRSAPAAWQRADMRYERNAAGQGKWRQKQRRAEGWSIRYRSRQLELRPTPWGQVGVFPEQVENWDWIEAQVRRVGRPLRVLNLFAYTGGATLAAAAAGAEVVHLDAAKTVVAWARRNAVMSNLSGAPIRWIVEDAVNFVEREVRRGNRYDAVILDPPSYGHGPKGEAWKIEKHLAELLSRCAALTEGRPAFILVSCHSPSIRPRHLRAFLADSFAGLAADAMRVQPLYLRAADGRKLQSGLAAYWPK
jgi:23S rRNA (cytosine1962-C5)-methyltransferase